MPNTRLSSSLLCTLLCCTLWASAAHGERGEPIGIGLDIEISRLLGEIESESAKQQELDSELQQLDARRVQVHQALKTRVRALYRLTRERMAPVAGGFEAIRRHVALVRRLKGLVESDARALDSARTRSESARTDAAVTNTLLAEAHGRLATLQKQRALTFVQTPVEPAPRTDQDTADHGYYGLRFSTGAVARSNFEALRGKLASPVTGEVRVSDERRVETEGPGLLFEAAAGTAVRAAASGRVAFCDRYGSYGRLVVLDHGDGYYTAYGGLGSVEVRTGDDLSAYARIGDIAGDSAQPGLVFEVRKGARAVAPRAWLGL
jgi:murein hydrolase activator